MGRDAAVTTVIQNDLNPDDRITPAPGPPASSDPADSASTIHPHPPPPTPSRPLRFARTRARLHNLHARLPLLHHLPLPSLLIILLLILINLSTWALCAIPLSRHPSLLSPALLAYTLGLRHALDADHISAIDLITRRLVSSANFNAQKAPVTVGTWFSLGHSTVVVVTAIVVAATATKVREKWEGWRYVGGIVGSSVSAVVLVGFGVVNAWMLVGAVRRLRMKVADVVESDLRGQRSGHMRGEHIEAEAEAGATPQEGESDAKKREHAQGDLLRSSDQETPDLHIHGGGCLIFLFRKLFRLINKPWKTYPLGIFFGLGFDTSSEIALLAISSIQAASGTSLWLILVFPVLFTAGMCLLDTADGALMMALYTSAARTGGGGGKVGERGGTDEVAPLYYNTVLTATTVVVALVIGTFQVLGMAGAILGDRAQGGAWDGINAIGDHYEAIGGGICGLFVVVGVASVVCYRPWRRWLVRRARRRREMGGEEAGVEMLVGVEGGSGEREGVGGGMSGKAGLKIAEEVEIDGPGPSSK